MIKNTRAIDIVVNIWTAQALANRPDRADFYKKMRVPSELYEGISLETMIQENSEILTERIDHIINSTNKDRTKESS